jgi:hypothetical protein
MGKHSQGNHREADLGMADPVTITISGATAVLVGERLFAYVIAPRFRQGQIGANSGDKDPSFWKQEFRQAIDEKLEQRIMPILERQTTILESVARTQEGMAVMVEGKIRRRKA